MENVISARRLRKSVLNSVGEVDLDLYDLNRKKPYTTRNFKEAKIKNENNILMKFKTKIILKLFLCSIILFLVISSKMFFLENMKNNSIVVRLYNHYITDFSRDCVLGKLEYRVNKLDLVIGNVIPDNIEDYIKDKYFSTLKQYIIQFDLKSAFKDLVSFDIKKDVLIENNNTKISSIENNIDNVQEKVEVLNGVGGAEPLKEVKDQVVSSISIMGMDVDLIKSKNINMIVPVTGVVTSRYGVRQEVFPGVDPYHTGIDIANKKGTEILSATKGIVTKVEYNNKYYGNFLEITENEVIFKYIDLDSINVKQGESIKQKYKIGLMGNTGMSTGTHLHFEIRINDRTVNPEELLKF
jgi:murein DD-endopeptidase MepM/ murein hydrolase activator NlpD